MYWDHLPFEVPAYAILFNGNIVKCSIRFDICWIQDKSDRLNSMDYITIYADTFCMHFRGHWLQYILKSWPIYLTQTLFSIHLCVDEDDCYFQSCKRRQSRNWTWQGRYWPTPAISTVTAAEWKNSFSLAKTPHREIWISTGWCI